MASLHDTAYPRLRGQLTVRELTEIYSPTRDELTLAQQATRGASSQLAFLVLLKTFQRLGYFVSLPTVPRSIVAHIASCAGILFAFVDLVGYDDSGTRRRHLVLIRTHLGVQPYGPPARRLLLHVMEEAARTKDEVTDLINIAIEELVRHRWELPTFITLQRAARHVRALVARRYYRAMAAAVSPAAQDQLHQLLQVNAQTRRSPWNDLKQDPGSATLGHFRTLLARYQELAVLSMPVQDAVAQVPRGKLHHFASEAMSLDAARMLALAPSKRTALLIALVVGQTARALDDLAEMLIKRLSRIHQRGKEALTRYREQHQEQTDRLIATLHEMVVAYRSEGTEPQRLAAIGAALGTQSAEVLQSCESYQAYTGNNYTPFLWRFYGSHRATLFRLLAVLPLESTSQDTTLLDALHFLQRHAQSRSEWLPLATTDGAKEKAELELSWIPEMWWRGVTGETRLDATPHRLNRRQFEICVFSQLMGELKSGDMCIKGSDKFADYRSQLIPWEEYHNTVAIYGEQVGLPTNATAFTTHTREWLATLATTTDTAFPQNTSLRIEHGEPILTRSARRPEPEQLPLLEQLLAARMPPVNILDVLADTEQWLNWTRFFGPLSGHDTKVVDPRERYVLTTFCYGCNLGPSQTARAFPTVDRRQLSWINQRHVSEEKLDQVITALVNAYNRFELPRYWGSGKQVSADGTKWDLYEQNLLSEYHIRYGGYGGIGYYHVSDTYIALFSHFIPCGVWEAVYILDGLLKNQSDLQPDTLHADTQGQSTPVFGLAYLLGIKLMPRIRNWKDLKLFRPDPTTRYTHLEELFSEAIDWELIQTHLPDMLRVALSIKAGCLMPSTILRKLGTASRKNKLYFAFRELGRVIRTGFLLQYVSDAELRSLIQAATNKSEAFNNFIQWLTFGGAGVIAENNRDEQRKIIKYGHVVANCLIFHNVQAQTRVLQQLLAEGVHFTDETIACLSPYLTEHVNRFGAYALNLRRDVPLPQYAFHNTLRPH